MSVTAPETHDRDAEARVSVLVPAAVTVVATVFAVAALLSSALEPGSRHAGVADVLVVATVTALLAALWMVTAAAVSASRTGSSRYLPTVLAVIAMLFVVPIMWTGLLSVSPDDVDAYACGSLFDPTTFPDGSEPARACADLRESRRNALLLTAVLPAGMLAVAGMAWRRRGPSTD